MEQCFYGYTFQIMSYFRIKFKFSVLIPLHSFFVSSENLVLNQHISEFTFIFLLVTCELENASNM